MGDLERIVAYATGARPGRRVHKQECGRFLTFEKDYGPFLDLVTAAVRPFDPRRGCEWDIKAMLHHRKSVT
jgi:hypothetical protein